MTTLVIGAGLVGSQIGRILAEQGEKPVLMDFSPQPKAIGQIVDLSKVVLTDGDVLRPLSIIQALREHKITSIIHTAANPLLTVGAQKDPYSAINLNIMGTVNVLEAARVTGIRRVVVSSSSVLNHFMDGGGDKGDISHEEAFPRPNTFYAATKQAVESLGLNYARWCGIDFAGMRYGAVFGPWGGAGGGGPSNTVRDAIRNALAGKESVLPDRASEWVYSKDAARGTVSALKANDLGTRIFNITMGEATSAHDLAEAIKKAVPGAKVRVEKAQQGALSLNKTEHAVSLARAKGIGYEPQYRLDAAVADMADWMRKNPM